MTVSVITSVLVPATVPAAPASQYDLTDLATVHDELKIATSDTNNDAWLSRAITQASTAIRLYCKQPFQIEMISDLLHIQQDPYPYQTPGGVAPLQLSRFPVVNMTTVLTSADTPSGQVLPFAATTGAAASQPISGLNIPPGATITAVTPTTVTISAPIGGDIPPATPITFGLGVAQTIALGTTQAMVLNSDYALDPVHGQLLRLDPFTGVATIWEALPVTANYSAGYAAVPPDVVEATLRLVVGRWFQRGVDPSLRSLEQPGVGTKTWWVGGPPKSGAIPEEIAGLLDAYRVPSAI